MKNKLERIKISEPLGYPLADTINRAKMEEQTIRAEVVETYAENNDLGLPPAFYRAYLSAAGAFDADFFDRANGYQILKARNPRPSALPRLHGCGLSLDFKAWMDYAFSCYTKAAEKFIVAETATAYKATGAKGAPCFARFRCDFKKSPRVSYTLEIDAAALAEYLKQNENEIREYSRTFAYAPMPNVSASVKTWSTRERRNMIDFMIYKQRQTGNLGSIVDATRAALDSLSDYYSANNSPLEEFYLSCDISYAAEMERLEKQGRDYLAIMGDKYAGEVSAGLTRNREELIQEMLEGVENLITARNNPGLVWEA